MLLRSCHCLSHDHFQFSPTTSQDSNQGMGRGLKRIRQSKQDEPHLWYAFSCFCLGYFPNKRSLFPLQVSRPKATRARASSPAKHSPPSGPGVALNCLSLLTTISLGDVCIYIVLGRTTPCAFGPNQSIKQPIRSLSCFAYEVDLAHRVNITSFLP